VHFHCRIHSLVADCIKEFELQEDLIAEHGVAGTKPGRDADGFCLSVPLNENFGHCLSSMNRLEDAEKRFTAALRLMRLAEAEDIKEADGASAGPRCDSFLDWLVVPTPHL